jgi:hypothetical protein
MLRIVFLVLLAVPLAGWSCEIQPAKIQHALTRESPEQVISRLWDNGDCETKLLAGLSSGKSEWLQLAIALRPHTDAWSSESLQNSLGEAMLRAPSRVLPLVDAFGFDNRICMPWGFDDSPSGTMRHERDRRMAQRMFRTFLKTSLAPQARKCLTAITR